MYLSFATKGKCLYNAYVNEIDLVDDVRKRVNNGSFVYIKDGTVEHFISLLIIDKESNATPQEKYQKKAGLVPKTYKLSKKLVDDFANTCEIVGITQAKQLSLMMQKFIDKNSPSK